MDLFQEIRYWFKLCTFVMRFICKLISMTSFAIRVHILFFFNRVFNNYSDENGRIISI